MIQRVEKREGKSHQMQASIYKTWKIITSSLVLVRLLKESNQNSEFSKIIDIKIIECLLDSENG